LALNVDIVRSKDFNLNLTATYNFNKNNIDELSEDALADTHTGWGSSMRLPYYDYIIRKGQPVGVIQGFKSADTMLFPTLIMMRQAGPIR
jgi:hypothetical protein